MSDLTADFEDDPMPCGEGMCRCDHYGEQHGPCGCDCPRDAYGQLIDEG